MTIECKRYDASLRPFEFGLGTGNEYGYVNVVIWATRDALFGYRDRRAALAERLAQLAENDPEFQRLLAEEASVPIR